MPVTFPCNNISSIRIKGSDKPAQITSSPIFDFPKRTKKNLEKNSTVTTSCQHLIYAIDQLLVCVTIQLLAYKHTYVYMCWHCCCTFNTSPRSVTCCNGPAATRQTLTSHLNAQRCVVVQLLLGFLFGQFVVR